MSIQYMSIPQNFWFLLFLVDLTLFGAVALYAYYSFYKRLGELKKVQTEAYKKAILIEEEAKQKTREILEKVEVKAEEILNHSELFKSDLDKSFKDSLKQLADSYLSMIQQHSQKFTQDYENILTSVKDQSLVKSRQALDSIEQEVKKQLEESKTGFKTEVTKYLIKAQEEIEDYKRKEIAKADQDIDQLIVQLAKDLLRINLTPKDHRKLVIQGLEKAKEQGMFFL